MSRGSRRDWLDQARTHTQRPRDVAGQLGPLLPLGGELVRFFWMVPQNWRRAHRFFQGEDGIRELTVTGVQRCALPIYAGGGEGGVVDGDFVDGVFAGVVALADDQRVGGGDGGEGGGGGGDLGAVDVPAQGGAVIG